MSGSSYLLASTIFKLSSKDIKCEYSFSQTVLEDVAVVDNLKNNMLENIVNGMEYSYRHRYNDLVSHAKNSD